VSISADDEIVLVVDVSSFTEKGFIGTSRFAAKAVSIEFDEGDQGLFLSKEMGEKLGVRKGSQVSLIVEAERTQVIQTTVAAVGKATRISDAKAYYATGEEGGAVIRIRKS